MSFEVFHTTIYRTNNSITYILNVFTSRCAGEFQVLSKTVNKVKQSSEGKDKNKIQLFSNKDCFLKCIMYMLCTKGTSVHDQRHRASMSGRSIQHPDTHAHIFWMLMTIYPKFFITLHIFTRTSCYKLAQHAPTKWLC